MRLTAPLTQRPAYYDRTPADKAQAFGQFGLAPTGNVVRWTYTVPANRKALVGGAQLSIIRQTAAAPAGIVQNVLGLTPSGGAIENLVQVALLTNTIGDKDEATVNLNFVMLAGDALTLTTSDGSTGGTTFMTGSCFITEFDA